VARDYHARVIEPSRSPKHAAQWISSLENHVPKSLWHAPIATIAAPALLDAIVELQRNISETASRIRQRLEAVFDDAEFRGLCTGNPARAIRRKLAEQSRRQAPGRFAALPHLEAPAFLQRLRAQPGIAACALEFGMLTASRTSEVLGALWSEFDLDAGIWTIPAPRMKAREAHTVSLTPRAIIILKSMAALEQPCAFPSPRMNGRPLSNMGMLTLLRRMGFDERTTVHGLCRATFSTWAYETGAARPDVIEACLAHREQDRVARAYNRAQFADERRRLLLAWERFLEADAANAVIWLPVANAA
jgi:integrase